MALMTDMDHLFGEADAVSKRRLLAGTPCLLFPVQWEEPFGTVIIQAMGVRHTGRCVARRSRTGGGRRRHRRLHLRPRGRPAGRDQSVAHLGFVPVSSACLHEFRCGPIRLGYEQIYRQVLGHRKGAGRMPAAGFESWEMGAGDLGRKASA